ncbi:flagellar motor protein MotB [Ahrensia sp. 13_GOM-1096m]|uniref:flagellar motor protein MotB n=1 Tax=Ahrensia sp. 13_GOM-1096m TaxID=1380380 RepID=UPI0006857004|nr:flagellar motor protein MotB [Ahrensia sp. 13_GOM-1096m]
MLGENEKQEIIIVRRSGGGEEGHHGGAWKIAFADFMTAMMALFLVLWLVNATDDKAQKSIASYFNPVKLVDSKKSEKGLSPADNTVEETELEHEAKGETEAEFFGNPAAVLDEIVAEDAIAAPLNEQLGAGTGSPSDIENDYVAEPVFIDPFSQTYWDEQGDALTEPETAEAESLREIIKEQLQEGETAEAVDKVGEQVETPEAELEIAQAEIEPAVKNEVTQEAIETAGETPDMQIDDAAKPTEAEALAAKVEETLEDVLNVIGLNKDQVRVVAQSEGVLVSLSDDLGFSMFGVGSAIPKAELINAVDAIGAQIADKDVSLSVIGHTDGRPYRGKAYDNWRLSAARAQATLYMLVRSGVDEKRIVSVSGKADRDLKNSEDPFAPENRRIDIMIALDSQ